MSGPALAEPLRFLELDEVFTARVRTSERFRAAFEAASACLATNGPLDAIERLTE